MTERPVIDEKKADEYRALRKGSNELLILLLSKYVNSADEYMIQLKKFYKENQAENLLKTIHTFKGSSLTMGLVQMSDLCLSLENKLKNKEDIDEVLEFETLSQHLIKVKNYLSNLK